MRRFFVIFLIGVLLCVAIGCSAPETMNFKVDSKRPIPGKTDGRKPISIVSENLNPGVSMKLEIDPTGRANLRRSTKRQQKENAPTMLPIKMLATQTVLWLLDDIETLLAENEKLRSERGD